MKKRFRIFTVLIITAILSFTLGSKTVAAEPVVLNPELAGLISGTETRITNYLYDDFDPSISGNLIVYTRYDENSDINHHDNYDSNIYYYDLSTDLEKQVTSEHGDQELSSVSNGIIGYTDLNTFDVMVYNTSNGQVTNLTAPQNWISLNPNIDGNILAYEDKASGNLDIRAIDLSTGELRQVTTELTVDSRPSVCNGIIVWEKLSKGYCGISSYNWETNQVTPLVTDPNRELRRPDTNGQWAVYDGCNVDEGDLERDIYLYNLETGAETRLEIPSCQKNAKISRDGDYVIFEDLNTEGVYHLKLWHIPSSKVFDIPTPSGGQFLNDIDGNRIVYTDDRNNYYDIYMYQFDYVTDQPVTVDKTPPATTLTADSLFPISNGWYTCDVEVSLTSEDLGESGVKLTEYSFNGLDWNAYSGTPFTISSEGATTVYYRSTDLAENVEQNKSCTIKVDKTPPLIAVTTPATYAILPLGTTLDFAITDNLTPQVRQDVSLDDGTTVTGGVIAGYTPGVGAYSLKIVAIDDAGQTATDIRSFVIYDSKVGSVRGAGWFNSPKGAYTGDANLEGKAHFGFVSEFKRGAAVPTGRTMFRLNTADMDFNSTGFEWLFVAGRKAQFKGMGTINGTGNYGFMISCTDGDLDGSGQDKFRIKIWDKNNQDKIIYDNYLGQMENADPATIIGGGTISIK